MDISPISKLDTCPIFIGYDVDIFDSSANLLVCRQIMDERVFLGKVHHHRDNEKIK